MFIWWKYRLTNTSKSFSLPLASESDIEFELELLNFLHQRQIPVAHPQGLRMVDCQSQLMPEGKRYYASLFTSAGRSGLGV